MNRTLSALVSALALLSAPALHAGERAEAALLPGWAEDGARVAGLTIRLAPGWKTYWRNPGDAGIPPRFDWTGSENVADVQIVWPRPHAFDSFGLRTLGYKGQVTLPLRITPKDPARPISLSLALDYGVCSDICVPERAELSLAVAPGDAPAAGAADAPIRVALDMRILPAAEAGLTVERCTVAGAGTSRRFEGAFRPATPFAAPPMVVIEAGEDVWVSPAEVRMEGGAILASAEVETLAPDAWIDRADISVFLLGEDQAFAAPGCGG